VDTHLYQVFTNGEIGRTEQQHIDAACGAAEEITGMDKPVIVGEWTPSMTDCAKYLNGRGTGSRYDGTWPGSTRVGTCVGITGKAATFSAEYKTFLRKTWEAQVITYEKASGWMQWTWKTEVADEWAYQAGLTYGWIPKNPTDLQYPNICG
jgi:aryl-phospho-beta-D-glucosidase BglC (GH1 family)